MMRKAKTQKVGILETFGLRPFFSALKDCRLAVGGNPYLLRVRFGLSSVRIFKPGISLPTWMGVTRPDRQIPLYNFFNRVPAPRDQGYSVRVTFARDFRGGRWTYDGHHGTDFAIPVGTPVTAAAPGRVLRVVNHMDHGGLKVCIDHGEGLITVSNHLARALVEEGDCVSRGQVVGLAGASGLEFILFFPWVAPHLHFDVFLNGRCVDPFAREDSDETPLWRGGNEPTPHSGAPENGFTPTAWNEKGIEQGIQACRDPGEQARLRTIEDPDLRSIELLLLQNFRSPLFTAFPSVYEKDFERRPHLDLPFRAQDFEGVAFPNS